MAMDLQKSDLKGLVAAIQAVAGVPTVLDPGTHGIQALNGNYRFETDPLEREIDRPGHGARPMINVKRRGVFEGSLELRGAAAIGTAAPIAPILRGCGFAQTLSAGASAVYNLVTGSFEMLTIDGYAAGQVTHGMDARGAITRLMMSVRNFSRAEFMIMGLPLPDVVEDVSLPTIDVSDFQAPIAIETESFEVDIGGVKLNAIDLTVDTNAQVDIYEGSETRFAFLREFYRPTGTLRVFKEQRSAFNPEEVALAHTLQDVYATITGGGEVQRLDLRNVQLGIATLSDQEGLAAWDIPFRVLGTSVTNCLSLSFLEIPS
jgi:hypothetical protein